MTSRNIFIGSMLILISGIIVAYCYTKTTSTPKEALIQNSEPPVFVWTYEKADSLNLDGLPQTAVFLEVTYPNGLVRRELIDTTDSGCNDLPDSDADSVPNSHNMQCYGAGLGFRFKVTRGEKLYLVKRKTFEEGLPDYNPPSYEYEVVFEFPLQ